MLISAAWGIVRVVGIAQVVGAIHVGAAHGLGDQLDFRRGAVAELCQIIGPQNIKHLDQHDAAGRGRRRAEDFVTVIAAFYRHPLFDLVVGKIGFRDQAAVRLHVGGQLLRDLAVVEVVRIGSNALQGNGELRLAEGVRRVW